MNDDGLAEGGGHDVVMSAERGEDVTIGEFADWVEPVVFADQGDSAADHDAARGEQCDDLGQGECKEARAAAKMAVASGSPAAAASATRRR